MTTPIDELFVFMSVDNDSGHSIVATTLASGSTPMVMTSTEHLDAVKSLAKDLSRELGKPIGMFRFKRGDTMWMTGPDGLENDMSAGRA